MAVISMVKIDNTITVDGNGQTVDLSSLASNIHAIQWDGSTGHIEYNDGKANETISSMDAYTTYTDAHASAKSTEDAANVAEAKAIQDAQDASDAYEASYQGKRQAEYPSIGNQLDALYHAGSFDATMTAQIKAVKDKYPK